MTQQLQDKKKLIEEVSNTIDNRFVFIQSHEHFVRCIYLLHIYFIYLFIFKASPDRAQPFISSGRNKELDLQFDCGDE